MPIARSPARYGEPLTVGRLAGQVRRHGPGQDGRRRPGLRLRYRAPLRLRRLRADGRPRGRRERASSSAPSSARRKAYIRAKREGIFHDRPAPEALRRLGSPRLQPRELLRLLRPRRTGPFLRAARPRPAQGRRPATRALGERVERLRDELVYVGEELRYRRVPRAAGAPAPREDEDAEAERQVRLGGPGRPGVRGADPADQARRRPTAGSARRGSTRRSASWPRSACSRGGRGATSSLADYDFLRMLINGLGCSGARPSIFSFPTRDPRSIRTSPEG